MYTKDIQLKIYKVYNTREAGYVETVSQLGSKIFECESEMLSSGYF